LKARKMNDIYLHVGLHKTGTSTLQRQFFPACKDITFLTTKNDHMRQFRGYVVKTDPLYFEPSIARRIVAPCLQSGKKTLMLNESFSGPPWAGLLEQGLDYRSPILSNLQRTFPDAKAIVIIRRQDGLARSLYRQYLKRGGTRSVQRFYGFESSRRPPLLSLDRFRFTRFIDALVESFPRGVLVLTFEEFKSSQKVFLRKLVEFIGIDLPNVELQKSNVSRLGPAGMEFTRLLNFFFRSHLNPAGFLPGIPQRIGGKVRLASPIQFIHDRWPGRSVHVAGSEIWRASQRVFEAVKRDNVILDEKYDLGLSRYGYY
jgi:hypothetical protein